MRSLRFKAGVAVVAFLALVSALLSTLFVLYLEQAESAARRGTVNTAAAVLADAAAAALATGDPAGLAAELTPFLHDRRIRSISVVADGEELWRADAVDPAPPGASPPLEIGTRVPGPAGDVRLVLAFSDAPPPSRVGGLRTRTVAVALAAIAFATAGALLLVGRILGPLQELARAAERVSENDYDVRLPVESGDEVGMLADRFNRMTDRLRDSRERHESWSRELEQRVRDATREIAETREHLANVVENVGASIVVADLDGSVVSANSHTMHLFGTKPEYAVGRPLDQFGGDALPEDAARELLRTGDPCSWETRTAAGGRPRDLLVTRTLLRDARGEPAGILQVAKDVTELKQMEHRLLRTERLTAMGEMAGEIGHELNNYLMAIGGRAELVLEVLARGGDRRHLDKIRRSAELISQQVAEMRGLTDGLLDSARKDSSPQRLDLNALAERTVEFVRPQNRFDGMRLALVAAPGPLRVLADPQQVRQVLLNLLTNAADANRERSGDHGGITVETFREGDEVGLRVRDEGPGVAESIRERIFEPHFTTKEGGHGFGLAVCHRVVANHGGSITIEPGSGPGATFTVRLPAPPAGSPDSAAGASSGREPVPSSLPRSRGSASPSSRAVGP